MKRNKINIVTRLAVTVVSEHWSKLFDAREFDIHKFYSHFLKTNILLLQNNVKE